jgi:SAM-dependent methyltransferase
VPLLQERGLQVTGVDTAPDMVRLAREAQGAGATFLEGDVLALPFPDGGFDGVICHRLLHHYAEPAIRVAALRELARVSRGVVIASFFNRFSLSAARRSVRYLLKGHPPEDRRAIPLRRIADEARRAGLGLREAIPIRWGISPLWILVLARPQSSEAPDIAR